MWPVVLLSNPLHWPSGRKHFLYSIWLCFLNNLTFLNQWIQGLKNHQQPYLSQVVWRLRSASRTHGVKELEERILSFTWFYGLAYWVRCLEGCFHTNPPFICFLSPPPPSLPPPHALSFNFWDRVTCIPGYLPTFCVAMDDLEFLISLPLPLKCQGYRYWPTSLCSSRDGNFCAHVSVFNWTVSPTMPCP